MFPLAALWWCCLKIKGELGQLGSYWNFPSVCFKIAVPQKQLHSKRASLTLKKMSGKYCQKANPPSFRHFFLHWKSIYITRRPSLCELCLHSFKYQKVCLDSAGDECHLVPHQTNRLRLCCHDPIPVLRSLTMYCILIIHLNLTFNLSPYWDRMFFRV